MNWKKIGIYVGVSLLGILGIIALMGLANYMFGPINIFLILGIELLIIGGGMLLLLSGSHRTSNEKRAIAGIIILLWMVIALFFYHGLLLPNKSETKVEYTPKQPTNQDVNRITAELDNANAQWANAIAERDAAKSKIEELQKALNKCKGIEEPLTPEGEIAKLKKEVAALKNAPRSYTSKPKNVSSTEDVVEKSFTGNNFKPKKTNTTEESFPADNTSLPITQYEGGFAGAYCLTINDDGYLVYALKNAPNITQAPLLNSENGPAMTLDNASGYWFYIDYTRLVSVQEINTWAYAMEWNVYIGQTNYGTGSYPTYLPHQSLKPLINKVRGKEWGEITDDDLVKMRKENSEIWTPESEGTLRPFRLDATNGRAYGKEDKNLYQGWNFRTKIYAKKRTTVQ